MPLSRILFALLVVGSVVGAAHRYLWLRLVHDLQIPQPWASGLAVAIGVGYVLLFAGLFATRLAPRKVSQPLGWVSYTWLGLFGLLLTGVVASDVVHLLAAGTIWASGAVVDPAHQLLWTRWLGGGVALVALGSGAYGVWSARGRIPVVDVQIPLKGLARPYTLVQVSDVHVGPTIGQGFIADMVASINGAQPDAVVITGDLVDGSVAELRAHVAPLADLKARDGVYFVTGNHEYFSGADAWCAHLGTLGVQVLRNRRVDLGVLQLAGVDDRVGRGYGHGHGQDIPRAIAGRDPRRPLVLLAHQPKSAPEAASLGVDLQLSGHTHGGQLLPFAPLTKLQQGFVAGLYKVEQMILYVSRGTGYWGPPMRVGAPPEITRLALVPA